MYCSATYITLSSWSPADLPVTAAPGASGSEGRDDDACAFSIRMSVQRKRLKISPVAVSDDSHSPFCRPRLEKTINLSE